MAAQGMLDEAALGRSRGDRRLVPRADTAAPPYGIDQMALAAIRRAGWHAARLEDICAFRPVDFYQEGGVAERAIEFVRIGLERATLHGGALRGSALLVGRRGS
jgi:hypothetical protein